MYSLPCLYFCSYVFVVVSVWFCVLLDLLFHSIFLVSVVGFGLVSDELFLLMFHFGFVPFIFGFHDVCPLPTY